MPIAERLSILSEINLLVFDLLEQDFERWEQRALRCLPVNVNITESLLLSGIALERIKKVLQKFNYAPEMIRVEVTESIILDRSITLSRSQLERMHHTGIFIALDDFGTGFANLSHLNIIPHDIIKIDRSFVQTVPHDKTMCLIIEAMIGLAQRLGKDVVCEGVEDQTTQNRLQQMGCHYFQGYLHSPPLSFEETCELLICPEKILSNKAVSA
ncbi:MAG: EAL domain-containing protein [Thiolinea sp.]